MAKYITLKQKINISMLFSSNENNSEALFYLIKKKNSNAKVKKE